MQCPYRNFQDCLLEKCPACVFEEIKDSITRGRKPDWLSYEAAEQKGMIWKETHTSLNEVMYEWTYEQVMQANAVLDMFQSNDIATQALDLQELENSTRK